MTRDQIITAAADAIQESLAMQIRVMRSTVRKGLGPLSIHNDAEREVAGAVNLAVQHERERCARIADGAHGWTPSQIAEVIRRDIP